MPPDMLSLFPELERDLYALRTTGTLPCQGIQELVDCGAISGSEPISTAQIQPASIDLRLGDVAYLLPSSFLPNERASVQQRVEQFVCDTHSLAEPTGLERGRVSLSPLVEELALPKSIWGKANPKSTSGR